MSKNYSSFWFDDRKTKIDSILANLDGDVEVTKPKPQKDHVTLASHKRAIGNFVRIVSGQNVPVKFMSRGDSFTDGKSVTISGTINEKNFDHVVGLALHEGSHIVYSDFDVFADVRNTSKLRNWNLTSERMEFFRNMINYIEDRRIDNIVFTSSPGYKGYYHTLYSKFFNHKTIGKGLKSKEYRGMDFESYLFRIINFTNPDTVLDALPRLRDIYRVIDMKNISRLKSTEDSINVAKSVCEIVFKIVEENQSQGNQPDGGSEEQENQEGGSSSPNDGNGTEVDTGDAEMKPDDNAQAGEELSESQKKQVSNIFKKSQDFLDGKTQKTKLTKNDQQIVDALSNSNSELVEAGDIKTGKTPVVVIPDLTQQLIDSRAFSFLYHYTYGNDKADAINEGLRLGAMLGKKLKVRGEEKDLIFTRQNTGKINKRLISELGFGNSNVFSQIVKEKYNRANLHL